MQISTYLLIFLRSGHDVGMANFPRNDWLMGPTELEYLCLLAPCISPTLSAIQFSIEKCDMLVFQTDSKCGCHSRSKECLAKLSEMRLYISWRVFSGCWSPYEKAICHSFTFCRYLLMVSQTDSGRFAIYSSSIWNLDNQRMAKETMAKVSNSSAITALKPPRPSFKIPKW